MRLSWRLGVGEYHVSQLSRMAGRHVVMTRRRQPVISFATGQVEARSYRSGVSHVKSELGNEMDVSHIPV